LPEEYSEPEDMATPKISVRSLLLSDDEADPAFKLPAIQMRPTPSTQSLPSLNELASSSTRHPPAKRHTEDELSRGVKRLELEDRPRTGSQAGMNQESQGARRRHADLIRGWLVAVNLEWRRRKLEEQHREEVGRLGLLEREEGEWDGSEIDLVDEVASSDEDESEDERMEFRGLEVNASRMREIVGI
jgi:hypothetical protein